MATELKPCPFCGGPAHYVEIQNQAECRNTNCAGFTVVATPSEWNRRAPDSERDIAFGASIVALEVLFTERDADWYRKWLAPTTQDCIKAAVIAIRRYAATQSSAPIVEVGRQEQRTEAASGGHQNRRSSDAGVSEADATSGVQPTGETAREDTHADRLEKIADMYGEMFDILDGARELAAQAREAAAVFRSAAEPPAA